MPTYRRPDDLQRCLAALAAQQRPADEIVVVARRDDAETHRVLADLGLPHRVVAPSGPGVVRAARAGMAAATADIVAIIDDDAAADPDWLARLDEAFRRPGVVAAGGLNRRIVAGVAEVHTATRVGVLSWWGRLVGMHYARTGSCGIPVQHLQGCNMAFARPWPLPDERFRGDGVFYELDLCLRAQKRGTIWYDERIAVDHHLAARRDRDDQGRVLTRDADRAAVRDACWNLSYALAKNTRPRLQRGARLLQLLMVGQRPTWGVLRAAVASARGERHPVPLHVLPAALGGTLHGWRAGSRSEMTAAGEEERLT